MVVVVVVGRKGWALQVVQCRGSFVISFTSCLQNIAHAPELLQEGLGQLSSLLTDLKPFLESPQHAHSSVLLDEIGPLSNMTDAIKSPLATPLLHKLVAVNNFIQLFIHLSRASQVGYNVSVLIVFRTLCTYMYAPCARTCMHLVHVHVCTLCTYMYAPYASTVVSRKYAPPRA